MYDITGMTWKGYTPNRAVQGVSELMNIDK